MLYSKARNYGCQLIAIINTQTLIEFLNMRILFEMFKDDSDHKSLTFEGFNSDDKI